MKKRNIAFLELYRTVDNFIRDVYASKEGVSEYIREMQAHHANGRRAVNGWDDDYRMLKHLRWVRNQLVHEAGYDADLCEAADYEWLKAFRKRLLSANDPLSDLARMQKKQKRRSAATKNAPGKARKKTSLWGWIKRLFG